MIVILLWVMPQDMTDEAYLRRHHRVNQMLKKRMANAQKRIERDVSFSKRKRKDRGGVDSKRPAVVSVAKLGGITGGPTLSSEQTEVTVAAAGVQEDITPVEDVSPDVADAGGVAGNSALLGKRPRADSSSSSSSDSSTSENDDEDGDNAAGGQHVAAQDGNESDGSSNNSGDGDDGDVSDDEQPRAARMLVSRSGSRSSGSSGSGSGSRSDDGNDGAVQRLSAVGLVQYRSDEADGVEDVDSQDSGESDGEAAAAVPFNAPSHWLKPETDQDDGNTGAEGDEGSSDSHDEQDD